MIDGDMIFIYDFAAAKQIEADLNKAGYRVTFGNVDKDAFKTEIAHMYRNGYKKIRFMDGKMEPFVVEREELYPYASSSRLICSIFSGILTISSWLSNESSRLDGIS